MNTRFLITISLLFFTLSTWANPPLSSWNERASRQAIIKFVAATTTPGSSDFVAPDKRIVVFDNDGTLWSEQPIYVQAVFVFDRIKQLAPQHPEWKTKEPFASVLKGDIKTALAGGEPALIKMVIATHANTTTQEFEKIVSKWIATARHPKTGRLYTEMVYQPMLELIEYFRANHFKVYIVSGGGIEFMRPWCQHIYGIPPEQIIGSSIKTKYEVRNGIPVIIRQSGINFINDKEGKPLAINLHIGLRPIAAIGNSDGDFQMLEWTTAGKGTRLGIYIHHDDAKREVAYDRKSSVGKLARGLDEASKRNWIVVSMKNDWKTIFPAIKRK